MPKRRREFINPAKMNRVISFSVGETEEIPMHILFIVEEYLHRMEMYKLMEEEMSFAHGPHSPHGPHSRDARMRKMFEKGLAYCLLK